MTQTLLERLQNPKTIDPHEVARGIRACYDASDIQGVQDLREAYRTGLTTLFPKFNTERVSSLVTENFLMAAELADIVAKDGYEASGQITMMGRPRANGPIATFYKRAIGGK